MKIAFIGGGNMCEAMLAGVLEKIIASAKNITVSDISESRRQFLADKYKVKTQADNKQAIGDADVIILAVKPQILPGVMSELKGQLSPEQLVLSIIAGAKIYIIQKGLTHDSIVRSMPNTPAKIGEGVTVWTATDKVTVSQKESVKNILSSIGKDFYVDDETYIDMATAISGSGPAYLFYFVEAMTDAAVKIGFTPDMAKELVMGTVLGAAHLIQKSDKEPVELRRMVTSPGGTTAAAIKKFEESDFSYLIYQAVKAAYNRAKELSNQK
jgi:pyrroline-5-carboxylate reductase